MNDIANITQIDITMSLKLLYLKNQSDKGVNPMIIMTLYVQLITLYLRAKLTHAPTSTLFACMIKIDT